MTRQCLAQYGRIIFTAFLLSVISSPAIARHYQRTTLVVENLVCNSCLSLIESNFQKIPGVIGMTADLRTGTVTADHIERIPGRQLAEVISRLGYPSKVISEEVIDDSKSNKFSNSFARCGVGGCSTGGCNATVSAWKELYRKYIKNK